MQALAQRDLRAEREIRRFPNVDVVQVQASVGHDFGVEGIVLEHDHAVEQRAAGRQVAVGLNLGQGEEIEPAGLDLCALELLQPRHQLLIVGDLRPRGHGVDEHAHHRLHPGQLGRAPGDGGPEHHITRTAITRQQQRPSTLHNRVHCQAIALGHLLQPDGVRHAEVDVHRF